MRQLHLEAEFWRPGGVRDGIGVSVDRTGEGGIRWSEAIASPGVVDVLSLVRVANSGGRGEPGRQSDGRLSEDRAAGCVDARVEPNLDSCCRLIDPERLMIEFVEEKHATDPCQPGLLVRDRDLFRQLMLQLVLVRRDEVELGDVGVDEEFVVQVSIRGQADQGGGWRERRRQAGARAVLRRAIPGERRCPNVVKDRTGCRR